MSAMQKVLLVSIDRTLQASIRTHLATDFTIYEAADGLACLQWLADHPPDLILMDAYLPTMGGWETLRRIRSQYLTPVVFLVERACDRVRALELGADDCLTKPCDAREVAARIVAIIRRTSVEASPSTPRSQVRCRLDKASQTAVVNGKRVELTPLEFDILAYLVGHAGQAVSREVLFHSVWGPDGIGQPRNIDRHVMCLRRKLHDREGRIISNVWGMGYRYNPEHDSTA